jgi:23S rRNA (cytosine1962-C5)-methyltransferase
MNKPRTTKPAIRSKKPAGAAASSPRTNPFHAPASRQRQSAAPARGGKANPYFEGKSSGAKTGQRGPASEFEERAPQIFNREEKRTERRPTAAAERKSAFKKATPQAIVLSKTAPRASKPASTGPAALGAKISRRAAGRLRTGYLWVYASDIESVELPEGEPPALLPVADSRGMLLGTALYSPTSQIALRMVSREAINEAAWLELLAKRLRVSVRRRKRLLDEQTDSCRLCFSEADELPGLVVDKYDDLIILQLLAKGLDSAGVRAACVRVLSEELTPAAILERPDVRVRELEGLAAPSAEPLYLRDGKAVNASTEFRLNGLRFHYDADSGQKTGAFLDQRANYAAAAEWARKLGATGRALDVCCYQGGFALHLAQVCEQVSGVDASRASLEVAERNLETNRALLTAPVEWVEGDAFEILRGWSDVGEKFDTIVLDPPAFAKSQRAVEGALRGYKELNLRALKMLRPGGLLVTCSCSHHVSWSDLEASVTAAAIDAHRRVRLLERRGAALDHPVVLNLPETEYLKCLVLEVE